jgi:two-component system NtrC family sensor kinase
MGTQAQELYHTLFQHVGDAILLIDTATTTIAAANPAAERMSGYGQAELSEMAVSRLIAPVLAGGLSEYDGLIRTRAGSSIPVSIGVSEVAFADTRYVVLIVRDISEHRRQAQSEKLAGMGRLTASIAHEINNPLQALHNTLHLLLSRPFPEEKRERLLTMAQLEVDRLSGLVQRMLELHRPTSGDMRPISIHGLLESALAGASAILQKHHVLIERDWAERLPWVIGIGGHLRQVFMDLAVNAVEAMPQGGRLIIRTRVDDSAQEDDTPQVLIEFADSGPGIPDGEAQRIFEPFYSSKRTSTGLGLAISYSIVERHGGMLSVSSNGSGTTFRVALPVALPAGRL